MDLEAIVGKFKAGATGAEGFDHPDALLEYAQQIQNVFSGNPPISKLDNFLGLTFPDSETDGLLPFLQKTIVDKKYDKAKELILNLVQYVLVQKAWKSDVNRFCLRFKTAVDRYWKNNKVSARLQQASLECLVSLYENHTVDLTDFETSQLFWALLPRTEKSSYQPTVRGKMFHLLGVLGALCQDMFKNQEGSFNKVFNHMTETVKSQVMSSDSHLEVSILHGCIKGINKLLHVYGAEINSGGESWILFQEHLEQIVDPLTSIAKKDGKAKIKRREFQRAALELVADHGALLKVGLFKKHRQWFEDLLEWSKSSNTDDNRIGRKAMYKFLDTVVEHSKWLKDLGSDEMSEAPVAGAEVDSFLKFFSDKFKTALTTKDVNRIELSVAVRGYGMLSNVCSDANQAQEMLNLIMEHVNIIIQELESPTFDKYSASLSILTTYLESVANILPSLKSEDDTVQISEDHLDSIRRLTILLIRLYPELSEGQRNFCYISVQKICDSLWYNHHPICEPFIEQVYRQSMLHIVSCPTRAEIDILIESYNKSNPDSKKSPYKQLGLKPVAFYVQFWKLLLSQGSTSGSDSLRFDLLMQWILTNIQKLDLTINFEENDVSESSLDPVQGATATVVKDFQIFVNIVDFLQELLNGNKAIHQKFEKWVNVFANEMLGYIRSHAYVSGFYKILAVVFDAARSVQYFEMKNEERRILQNNLNVFFGKLGTKIREFRDDLLFAVLELWLSLPDELILSNFTALNNTLQTVFITGRNSFSLAIRGLEAIERWFFQPEFPVEEIKVIMNDIFPILKTYFIHSASTDIEATTSNKATSIGNKSSKGKGVKDLIKKNVQSNKVGEDVTLKKTQFKILQLIGNFGQFLQLSDKEHSGLAKDQRFLQYAIPFQDCKPEISIDYFLPIVLELCESAVERQTRISACEFFHTIALIFIGRSREKFTTRLFKKILESMLKLGCDSDIVVRQLFNPLCLQTIHWFSKTQFSSSYGPVVLDILTENLTQHRDPGLRELAALCFGEYFGWSLKHGSSSSKGVLKTIFALSTHASVHYRQGSVLAFNSIYKDFREDAKLVNVFSFNLLYSFLTSLKLSKDLPEDSLLVTSTRQSIKHLERIVIKKKDLFNTAIPRQFKPMTNAAGPPCLKNVVEWLLCQGGIAAAVYRNECLRLINVFSQYAKDFGSTAVCLSAWEETNGVEGWIRIAEKDYHSQQKNPIHFLDASSEFYHFLFEFNILKKAFFSAKSGSKFSESLLTLCSQIQPLSTCSLSDEEKTQALNIFSRLEFAWGILDGEELANLWFCSMELSQNMASLCPLFVIEDLVKVWRFEKASEIVKNKCQPLLLFEPVEDFSTGNEHSSVISLLALADWFKVVAEGGIMERMLSPEVLTSIKDKLWSSINQALFKQKPSCSSNSESSTTSSNLIANNLNLNQKKIVESYLITAISLGLDQKLILDAVFDAVSVTQKDGTFLLVTTKGSVFQKQIMNALVYCESLFQFDKLLQERPIKEVGELILRLLDVIKSDKMLKERFGKIIFKKIITNWKMISINCDMPISVKIFVGLVTVDAEACKNSDELSSWWNGQGLMQARHLDIKQKAGVFGYAAVFASSRSKKTIEVLTQTISSFIENELAPETMNWTEVDQYVNHIFRKLLQVSEQLISSNSALLPAILTLLQKVCVWVGVGTTDHPIFRLVRDSLGKMVKVLLTTDDKRVDLASELYELITSDGRRNRLYVETTPVWKSSLIPVVSSLGIGPSKCFFKKHIYSIITTMQIKPTSEYDWHRKTVAVNLLELFVYQTSGDFVKSAEISRAYWNKAPEQIQKNAGAASLADEKTVLRSMIKVCAEGCVKMPALPEDPVLRKRILAYSEACYNTSVAVLLETKTVGKLCVGFLFPGQKMFENIIDTAQVYEIPVVIDEERSKAGKMLFSRNRRKISSESTSYYGDPAMSMLPRSGNLSGSSLEPEATSYDFTTTVTVSNSEFYQNIFGNQVGHGGNNIQAGNSFADSRAQLEWNEINEHSCMFAFVETLKYMSELHRSKSDDGNRGWINALLTILKNGRIHKNVKLFIVGGIINTPESVEPFAKDLVEPITQLIVSDCFGSVGLNHFVQDTILTLLSWHNIENSKPEPETVTNLLKYIIQHVGNEEISKRKDVFGHAMVILQNIVKHWVAGLAEIPKDEVASLASNSNLTDESAFLFLNVSLNILLGGQLPQTDGGPLLKKFMKSVTSRFKGIYVAAAKCLGAFLRICKSQAPPDIFEKYVDDVKEKISTFKSKASMFVDVLSAMQPNFPEIMVHCKNMILELCQFPKVRPELLALLPLLLQEEFAGSTSEESTSNGVATSARGDEFYTDIKGRGFFNLSQPCKSESELGSALDLLELLVDNTSEKSDLLEIVNWLNNIAEACSDSNIKVKFAKCLQKLYEKMLREAVGSSDDNNLDSAKRKIFFRIFIRLYEDEDEEVQQVVHQFWAIILSMWSQSSAQLLLELFDLIGEEEHPLNVCLGIMLQRCSLAPDYFRDMFLQPLEDCDFYPFQLDTSWRLRNSSFQPLFSDSLSTAQNFTVLPRAMQNTLMSQRRSVGKFGMNVLRATLTNLQFTPTQQDERGNGTVGGFPMEIDNYTQNFQPGQSYGTLFDNNQQHRNQSSLGSDDSPSSLSNPILKLRRKFYTRKEAMFYATIESEKRSKKIEDAKELQLQKISGVKTVRSYRIGELPDILITHSDFLKTLLKLARLDERVAQTFIIRLYGAMLTDMDSTQSRRFLSKSKDIFDRVLRNSLTTSDRSFSSLLVELSVCNNISLPLTVILEVSKITHMQKLGILKVERELLNETEVVVGQKRIKLPSVPNPHKVDLWLGLAEMYKEIEEHDVLRNIFVNINQCPMVSEEKKQLYETIGNALYLEGKGELERALDLFDSAWESETEDEGGNTTTKYFLEDAMMHCLTQLGDWDTLFVSSLKFNSTLLDDILQDQNVVERLIPSRMLAGMHLTLRYSDDGMDHDGENEYVKANVSNFHEFVENLLSTEEGTSFMSARYPFEAAAWFLVDNEEEYSHHAYIMQEKGYETTLANFKSFDGLSLKSQRQVIIALQQSSVVQDYLQWKKPYQDFRMIEERTKRLLGNWSKHFAYQPTDLIGSDYVGANRDCFASKIGVNLQEQRAEHELLSSVQELRVEQDIWLTNLGIVHKNYTAAQTPLTRLFKSGREDLKLVEYRKSMARFLAAFPTHFEKENWCKRWCQVWKKIDKIDNESEQTEVRGIKAALLLCALEAIDDEGSAIVFAPIIKMLKGAPESSSLTSCIFNATEELMKSCNEASSSLACNNGPIYAKLFYLMKKLTDNFNTADYQTAEKMMTCLIGGTVEGSANDMLLLSNMFSLMKKFPDQFNATFETMAENIPTFLFLPWIDQIMTAYKASPEQYEQQSFKKVIDRLVKEFPQAFQIQYSEYLNTSQRLFAKALNAVVLPFKLHESQVNKILVCQKEDELIAHLIEFQSSLQEIINNDSRIYGEYHTDYATKMFNVVNNTVTEYQRSSQSSESDSDSLRKCVDKCKKEAQKIHTDAMKVERSQCIGLEKLSPFLAEFHFFEHELIEKPGLYENFKRPRLQDHPVIVSFHPTVDIYKSLTRPLKLTVITNDGKKSNFLAKLGDDIRQDRRIQQLFKMSNVLLQKDAGVRQRKLAIETYSCIPISPVFGIIEMVDNVMSLAEVMFDTTALRDIRERTMKDYDNWMWESSFLDRRTYKPYAHYTCSAKISGRQQSTDFLNKISSRIPKYLLRDNIQRRSDNYQEFFSIRQNLIRSYGALCMVHWLGGIGDRHLENCLLSMDSGKIVGIDFGRAFGTSNYVIPIPELVPFRLTSQLQQLMSPYTFRGLFRESCILTWNCLQSASDLILTVADVFIQEPSMDWLKLRSGSKSGKGHDQDDAGQSISQLDFPFEIMKKKLLNHNPTRLVLEELKMHSKKEILEIYSKIAEDGRIHLEKDKLSDEEYVDVLLDLATDKSILSRLFAGWNSWA